MGISEHLWVWSVGMCPYSAWWCWWQGENRRNVCGRDKTAVALPQSMAHALCCTVQAQQQAVAYQSTFQNVLEAK